MAHFLQAEVGSETFILFIWHPCTALDLTLGNKDALKIQ